MNNILPEPAQKIIQSGGATIIDVRTPEEFNDGHIPGARNINIADSTFSEKIHSLDPDGAYVVNCKSGIRSAKATALMNELGFKNVINLEGGFMAWENAGLPVE